ncbi:hypothetical protein LPJ67_006846, partial [Coemansia sp. RSA 1938]
HDDSSAAPPPITLLDKGQRSILRRSRRSSAIPEHYVPTTGSAAYLASTRRLALWRCRGGVAHASASMRVLLMQRATSCNAEA